MPGMEAYLGASQAVWQAAYSTAAALDGHKARLRQQALLRKFKSNPKRLAVADQALQEGDIDLACIIYTRLAVSRPRTTVTEEAKQRIADLQRQARQELKEIDAMLTGQTAGAPAIPGLIPVGSGKEWEDRVVKAFQQYDRLAQKYARLPVVGDEITKHLTRQRGRPTYAAVLNEAKARSLWELAQRYEQRDHQCCAYLVYEEAARLVPAPSARLAQERFAKMSEDPQIVASSESCRELQWCLETYLRAEQLAGQRPDRAKALFQQIAQRAPEDSEVYRAARKRIGARN